MTKFLLLWTFFVLYEEGADLLRSYIFRDLKSGVVAGFSLNRTDSKLGDIEDTEPVSTGGYEGGIFKIFDFGNFDTGIFLDFKDESLYVSGLYSDTSIPDLTLYKLIEHAEEEEEISAGVPFLLKIFKNLMFKSSLEFSWKNASLQHGDVYTNYSAEVIKLSRNEVNFKWKIGGVLKTGFLSPSISFGIPLFLRGDAKMMRYKGATILIEPFVQWGYDPKPPPFINTSFGFRSRNFSILFIYSFYGRWGGGFYGIDRTEYRLKGIPSHEIGGIASFRVSSNEFLMGFNYEGKDYTTENIPYLTGDRFLIILGYEKKNRYVYGIFLKCLLSERDSKFLRKMSVFLTRITMDFSIGF